MSRQLATQAVRAGLESDQQHGAVVPPLHLSSTFTFAGFNQKRPYDYSRSGNPTRDQFADALATLEGGAGAVVTASGMAAITNVVQLLKPDDLVIVAHDCYGGSYRLFDTLQRRRQFHVKFLDLTDPAHLEQIDTLKPAMVWVETPSNPLLRVTDIAAVAAAAHDCGACVVADNTFLSPALQNPLALGADIVVHSTTKYINGHSDVVGGAVIAASREQHEELAWWANCLGLTGAPFDSYLSLRGLRTLDARIRIHEENAGQIAHFLEQHPAVASVHYPGLDQHPGHALAKSQQRGFGGMLSFSLKDGLKAVQRFLPALQSFSLAESLGGVESLIAHPATMTHAAMAEEARLRAGIDDGLLRLSIGIEHIEDLRADLDHALRLCRVGKETPHVYCA